MSDRYAKLEKMRLWDALIRRLDAEREQAKTAIQVVRGKEVPLENNQLGLIRWYLHPDIDDTIIRSLISYIQEIPPGSRSGRLKCQGGQTMYIIEGRGHTILDGVRHDWKKGDAVNLPLRPDGNIVQHFNDETDTTVRFLVTENNWVDCLGVDRGVGFEVLEPSPDYKPPAY